MLDENLRNDLFRYSPGTPKELALIKSLTPVQREQMIDYCRKLISEEPKKPASTTEHQEMLIELGDDKAIADNVSDFAQIDTSGYDGMFYTAQPKVITAVAPYLFKGDPVGFETPETADILPLPLATAEGIRKILARSPSFSPEVNQWAASWPRAGGNGRVLMFQNVIRQWWNANQRYFYAGNYKAVQPGDPLPEASPSPTPDTWIGPTPYPPPVATASPVQAVTPAPSASIAPVTRPLLLPVAIGLLALIGAGVALFLRLRK